MLSEVLRDKALYREAETKPAECAKSQNPHRRKQVHTDGADYVCDSSISGTSAPIRTLAKCSSTNDAHQVFGHTESEDVVACNALILGYAEKGQSLAALELFTTMRPAPNSVTFVAALKACSCLAKTGGWAKCRDLGNAIYNLTVENGCDTDIYVQNALIETYARCGSVMDSRRVFDHMKHTNIVSWNVLLMGYAENGQGFGAFQLFARMRNSGPAPNSVSFLAILKACTSLVVKKRQYRVWGKAIHNLAVESVCSSNIYVQSTLIDMYAKSGFMVEARQVFDSIKDPDVVTWTVLLLGYADCSEGHTALQLFREMSTGGPAPNRLTFVGVLKAITSLAQKGGPRRWKECRERGEAIENLAAETGCHTEIYVQSTLIDMYSKCGSILDARRVFDGIEHPNIVSWDVLIMGYAENGQGRRTLEFFRAMRRKGPAPDSVTFVGAFKACVSLVVEEGASEFALYKPIFNLSVENGCNSDVYVQNTLIDMHAKCGAMGNAREVFDSVTNPSVVSWNVLIQGYADNGQALEALDLFTRMESAGPEPDIVTFMAVLKACALLGALEFGRKIISGIHSRSVVFVTCLVDFFAKCGCLEEAKSLFDLHAQASDMISWNALLAGFSSCADYESVLGVFRGMQEAGFGPNAVSFLSILTCYCHAGLVEKGKECFDAMPTRLDAAMALLESMPCSPDEVTWRIVLGACRQWKNVEIGRLAFQSFVDLNERDAGVYVIMGQIYASRGMLQEQDMVLRMRKRLKAWEKPEEASWTNEPGQVHSFLVRSSLHAPQR